MDTTPQPPRPRRFALVGTGSRAEMFVRAVARATSVEIEIPEHTREGHGGADARMTAILFGGQTDPLDRSATELDGALALLTGLAANGALATGRPVRVYDLLRL